jgi:N-acetylglucosaminyl-diphospho-decaprenol L-rhamnosyltransferase
VSTTATVIVPTMTPSLVVRLLDSLREVGGDFETIVIDNGTGAAELDAAVSELEGGSLMRLGENLGYSRPINLAARRAQGDVLVLLNDDCVVDPGFVGRIAGVLDPGAGVVMAAGVMRDAGAPELIETAGVEIDRTLLAYDYLNGEPLSALEGSVADPIGPSGAAAAFDREAFLSVGGFDERIFAYLEDVDLVLRLRRDGGRCRLAKGARGVHEHSATLGPGSPRKDYLAGFGRGYLLRKWSVVSPGRLPTVLFREVGQAAVQSAMDRNLGPVRGRVNGLRAGRPSESYPSPEVLGSPPSLGSAVGRRWRRRARLRRKAA